MMVAMPVQNGAAELRHRQLMRILSTLRVRGLEFWSRNPGGKRAIDAAIEASCGLGSICHLHCSKLHYFIAISQSGGGIPGIEERGYAADDDDGADHQGVIRDGRRAEPADDARSVFAGVAAECGGGYSEGVPRGGAH